MKKEFTAEMAAKAKTARSVKELLEIAKDNGYVLSATEAEEYFNSMNVSGAEISDDDIDSVSGGVMMRQEDMNGGYGGVRSMSSRNVGGIMTMANQNAGNMMSMSNPHAGETMTMARKKQDGVMTMQAVQQGIDDADLISGPGSSM